MKSVRAVGLVLFVFAACPPSASPGGHHVLSAELQSVALPEGCSSLADAGFTPRTLELELWSLRSGTDVLRFVPTEPVSLGDAYPVVLPEGVWGGGLNFAHTATLVVDGGSSAQALSLALSTPADGGVASGTLALSSSFTCSAGGCGYTSCAVTVPVTLKRLAAVSTPVAAPNEVVPDAQPYLVSVNGGAATCGVAAGVHFETWQATATQLTLASGTLTRDSSRWVGGFVTVTGFADALEAWGTLRFFEPGVCDVSVNYVAISATR